MLNKELQNTKKLPAEMLQNFRTSTTLWLDELEEFAKGDGK